MKSVKPGFKVRAPREPKSPHSLQQSISLMLTSGNTAGREKIIEEAEKGVEVFGKSPRDKLSFSDSQLQSTRQNANLEESVHLEKETSGKGDESKDEQEAECIKVMPQITETIKKCTAPCADPQIKVISPPRKRIEENRSCEAECHKVYGVKQEKSGRCFNMKKKIKTLSPSEIDSIEPCALVRQIRDIHVDTRKSARIIRDSRARLLEIQKKTNLTEADIKELGERNDLLLREMERFERLTRSLQKLVGNEAVIRKLSKEDVHDDNREYIPGSVYEPAINHEMKMPHPTILLAGKTQESPALVVCDTRTRSKSEIDLTRKLNESYDMQEKLVADNADLEVKRYILYKELMTKDQNLETCRSQIKRLQGELKLMNKENTLLLDKLGKNNPEGDACAMRQDHLQNLDADVQDFPLQSESSVTTDNNAQELVDKLEDYKTSSLNLEKQLGELEVEVRYIQVQMNNMAQITTFTAPRTNSPVSACRGGAGQNTCFQSPPAGSPTPPPMSRICGVCPPCPAPCNPNGPPTPAEKEVQRLSILQRNIEESFKVKVTECAMLRAELVKKKEELEKERCEHREVQNRLRELEMKFEGLTTHTNMMLGTKEQAIEQEVNVRSLKQCYRQAREEIDELNVLLKEQTEQLQDYRVKYLKAQQLVEEQRRQMDILDMDNVRISEQINLEIHKIKLTFQEKLQELAALPDLLNATQRKLKDSQQQQALAEHKSEQLARELACAREKVHILLHKSVKPPEKTGDKSIDEKQIAMLQQRISQLTENNISLKSDIERLKSNVIRMEEAVVANEKRLQEKMHECAALGGELDRARDEAARALQRAGERTDTIRKCMQTTVAELEKQLASSRAQVVTAEKEREEVQNRMTCQIQRLNDNFEQAQYRILGLQAQVQTLRRATSSTGMGDADNVECACKSFFDDEGDKK